MYTLPRTALHRTASTLAVPDELGVGGLIDC